MERTSEDEDFDAHNSELWMLNQRGESRYIYEQDSKRQTVKMELGKLAGRGRLHCPSLRLTGLGGFNAVC
jgi:hypothetical protein